MQFEKAALAMASHYHSPSICGCLLGIRYCSDENLAEAQLL